MSSSIIVKCNLNTTQLSIDDSLLGSYSTTIFFNFDNGEEIVNFNNLSFGYNLKLNNETVSQENYPLPHQEYISTDQEYLECRNVDFLPGRFYTLYVWCNENGNFNELTHEFTSPIPEKPYPSWVWTGTGWIAPIPLPDSSTGNVYNWNETTQSWEFFSNMFGDTTNYDVD